MRKIVTFGLIIILFIAISAFITYTWYQNVIFSENISSEDVNATVKSGDNLISILPQLSQKGLIANEELVKVYIRLNDLSANIKAGEYSIPKGTNVPNIIRYLEAGTFKVSVSVTIPEGLRYEFIADILEERFADAATDTKFRKSEFLAIAANPDNYTFSSDVESILAAYKPEGKPLRGLLFPDTYRFDFDSTEITIIETLVRNFGKRLRESGISQSSMNSKQSNIKTIYDALKLASIIEWEGDADDNLGIISSIFHNRLKINYPLQADSTVNFITGKRDPGVLISDTKIDSPYNTYMYAGLPPTPISNPGIRAIKAALEPENSDYFYFLHDASGKLYYARTYEEHVANVNRYL